MRSQIVFGLLASLCGSAYGVKFHDKIKQNVGGDDVYLGLKQGYHVSVLFSQTSNQVWEFNTDGLSDVEAVISPADATSKYLACWIGAPCTLESHGSPHSFLVTRDDDSKPVFTFQDPKNGLYVTRAGQHLELRPFLSDEAFFTLEKPSAGSHEQL